MISRRQLWVLSIAIWVLGCDSSSAPREEGGETTIDAAGIIPDGRAESDAGPPDSAADAATPDSSVDFGLPPEDLADAGSPDLGSADVSGVDENPFRDTLWSLEQADWVGVEEMCSVLAGRRALLTVTYAIEETCQYPGPVSVVPNEDGELILTAYRWINLNEECMGVTGQALRQVLIEPLTEGVWPIRSNGEEVTRLTVEERAFNLLGSQCGSDSDCFRGQCLPVLGATDCDWAMYRCTGALCDESGGHGEYQTTERGCPTGTTCQSSLALCDSQELAGEAECAQEWRGDFVKDARTCMADVFDECPATCAFGRSCQPLVRGGYGCVWDVDTPLNDRDETCQSSTDCPFPLECVMGIGGHTWCGLRCITTDMDCPGDSQCQAEGDGLPWVCVE